MFGFSWIKVAAAAIVLAALASAVAYVYSLRATIAAQQAEIQAVTTERDQEKATAARNLDAYRAAEAQRLVEAAMRRIVEKRAAAARQHAQERIREMERASDGKTLGPTLRPLLRRPGVQQHP